MHVKKGIPAETLASVGWWRHQTHLPVILIYNVKVNVAWLWSYWLFFWQTQKQGQFHWHLKNQSEIMSEFVNGISIESFLRIHWPILFLEFHVYCERIRKGWEFQSILLFCRWQFFLEKWTRISRYFSAVLENMTASDMSQVFKMQWNVSSP